MTPNDLPPQAAELMLQNGAVILFGPDYLENSLQLANDLKGALPGLALISCEKVDDLNIPDGPMLNGSLIFFHRKPAQMDAGDWDTALLQGIDLRSFPPRGLGVGDPSPEEPTVELVPAGGDEMQLIVTWLRPLESGHIARTARAIELSYRGHGGRYP